MAFISDTHGMHDGIDLSKADAIVHCGDLTNRGHATEAVAFMNWFEQLPYKYKVFIAGNHDFIFEGDSTFIQGEIKGRDFIYLEDSGVRLEGFNFYGSPWQPWFFDWAFNLERGPEIAKKWSMIPDDTDILITHGPPKGILDKTLAGVAVGCYDLLQKIHVVRPKIHAFGHIHEGYGIREYCNTEFVNASICTRSYDPINKAIVVEV